MKRDLLHTINYIHKLQGIDKCVPLLMQLRAEHPNLLVTTVVDIESKTRLPDCTNLIRLLGMVSDVIVFRSGSYMGLEWARYSANLGIETWLADRVRVAPEPIFWRMLKGALPVVRSVADPLSRRDVPRVRTHFITPRAGQSIKLLTIYNGVNTKLGKTLTDGVQSNGGTVLGYLKTVNDEGLGFGAIGHNGRMSEKKVRIPKSLDVLLVPNRRLREIIYSVTHIHCLVHEVGHVQSFPAWIEFLRSREDSDDVWLPGSPRVAVFSKGYIHHRKEEQQLAPRHTFNHMVDDILEAVLDVFPSCSICIKPHPHQDTSHLDAVARKIPSAQVSFQTTGILSVSADLVISMHSSAIVDALICGTPAIEYSPYWTDYLEKVMPGGSPFVRMGATEAREKRELQQALIEASTKGDLPQPRTREAMELLHNKKDLSVFT